MSNIMSINQYLLSQFNFDLSEFAFLVECTNDGARSLLQLNPLWVRDGYEMPISMSPSFEEDEAERATPYIQPSAWLFPRWQPEKNIYYFGTYKSDRKSGSKSDIVIPRGLRVSRRHFAMYRNEQGVSMIQNYSDFGTLVNGDFLESMSVIRDSNPLSERSRHSLTPGAPNTIVAGSFDFTIHLIPHNPLSAGAGDSISPLLDMCSVGLGSQTCYSSTAGNLGSIVKPTMPAVDMFYYLEDGPIHAQGPSKVFIALHKRTGHLSVAKAYDRSQEKRALLQYEMMLDLQDCKHILSYLDFVQADNGVKIFTSFIDAVPLAIAGDIQLEDAFLIYRQIAGALQSLERARVEHNDISENTILLEHKSGLFTAYLTGFSEFKIAEINLKDCFYSDVSCLTAVIRSKISTHSGHLSCDPGLESIMFTALHGKLTASNICNRLDKIATNYKGCPFKRFYIKKIMCIKRIVDINNVEAIRLIDFLRIVLYHNAEPISVECLARKLIRRERLLQLNNETFCYLEDAEKLISHIQSKLSIYIDLSPPYHHEACWYETRHEISFPISYHEPSGMVNITQILNTLDNDTAHRCLEAISPNFQQVRGLERWEGYYIDSKNADEFLNQADLVVTPRHHMIQESSYTSDIFYNNDPERFIIIACHEMIGLVLLRRDGLEVKYNGNTKIVQAAITECEEHGLSATANSLRTYIPSEPVWTSYNEPLRALEHFNEPDCPSEATAQNFSYDPENIRFIPRKRKGSATIPVLPQPKRLEIGQTTVKEKCENWTKGVNVDISSTKFQKRNLGSDKPTRSLISPDAIDNR